jgi:hypothetical protein
MNYLEIYIRRKELLSKGTKYKYEDYHRIINGVLYKKCVRHEIYFPDEDPWLLATTDNFYKNDKNAQCGLNPDCKRCSVKISQETHKRYPERRKENDRKRYREDKDYFIKKQRRNRNKKHEQYLDYERGWRNKNRDKVKEYNENHRNHEISE